MIISIGVMAHIKRMDLALDVFSSVSADVMNVDRGHLGENQNGDQCWETLSRLDSDWSVVLQDDAVPVPDFRAALARALLYAPQTAVGLYVGTGRPFAGIVRYAAERADELDASWLEDRALLWGVGVAMPTAKIQQFLRWAVGSELPYDQRIGHFWRASRVPVRYVWPSLVDHLDGETIVHLSKPTMKRVAHRVGARELYDGPVVEIGASAL